MIRSLAVLAHGLRTAPGVHLDERAGVFAGMRPGFVVAVSPLALVALYLWLPLLPYVAGLVGLVWRGAYSAESRGCRRHGIVGISVTIARWPGWLGCGAASVG
jgi:hypothetical protein